MDYKNKKDEMYFKAFTDKQQEWYEKNFFNKPLHNAIFDNFKEALAILVNAQCLFMFLSNSCEHIKNNKKFFDTFENDDKILINETIKSVDIIIEGIDEILTPVADGLVCED